LTRKEREENWRARVAGLRADPEQKKGDLSHDREAHAKRREDRSIIRSRERTSWKTDSSM